MKTYLILLFFLLLSTATLAQAIRRVNNNPGATGTNIYSTIQSAHDAATSGDVIYVEPSVTSYGDLLCSKNLKIYGPGYFLDVNTELSPNDKMGTLGIVTFAPGSQGSEIYGCNFNYARISATSNIKIKRNKLNDVGVHVSYTNASSVTTYASVSDIEITQNYLSNCFSCLGAISTGGTGTYSVTGILISNNYFGNDGASRSIYISNIYTSGVIVNNNIFTGTVYVNNTTFSNNILFGPGSFTATSSTVLNNVTNTTVLPVGSGNQNSRDLSLDLSYLPSATVPVGISADERWILKATSTLKTEGTSGSEIGMFGGSTPYVVSGIPAIPSIGILNATATGNSTTPISVTISTKSNN